MAPCCARCWPLNCAAPLSTSLLPCCASCLRADQARRPRLGGFGPHAALPAHHPGSRPALPHLLMGLSMRGPLPLMTSNSMPSAGSGVRMSENMITPSGWKACQGCGRAGGGAGGVGSVPCNRPPGGAEQGKRGGTPAAAGKVRPAARQVQTAGRPAAADLQRQLNGNGGRLGALPEGDAVAVLAEGRHVAARLPHQPHGRALRLCAPGGQGQATGWSGHRQATVAPANLNTSPVQFGEPGAAGISRCNMIPNQPMHRAVKCGWVPRTFAARHPQ